MKPTTIFITYNPQVPAEQTLAVRLHSIGAVSGFRMYMPDRYNSDSFLDTETQRRIENADYMVFFSLGTLSPIVKQEIEFAFQHFKDKSKIIVIYDERKGKNITGDITEHFTAFHLNPMDYAPDNVLQNIINQIFQKQQIATQQIAEQQTAQNKRSALVRQKQANESQNAFIALLGIGLGLLVLGALAKDK
jgi:hypothetical protein